MQGTSGRERTSGDINIVGVGRAGYIEDGEMMPTSNNRGDIFRGHCTRNYGGRNTQSTFNQAWHSTLQIRIKYKLECEMLMGIRDYVYAKMFG